MKTNTKKKYKKEKGNVQREKKGRWGKKRKKDISRTDFAFHREKCK